MRIGTRILSTALVCTLLMSTEAGAANIMTDLTAGAGKKEASASVYVNIRVVGKDSATDSSPASGSFSAVSRTDSDRQIGGTSFDRRGEAAEGASVSSSGVLYTESHDGTDDIDDIYADMCIVKIDDSMSIRSEASEDAEPAGYIYKDCIGEILEQKGSWTKIRSGNLEGWIKNSYLLYGESVIDRIRQACMQVAVINTETLRVRKEASEDASIIALLGEGDEVDVVDMDGDDWTEIEYEDGTEGVGSGYVSNEYITLKMMYKTGETLEEVKAREEASRKASDESKKAEDKKAEDKKAEDKKAEDKKTEDKKTEDKKEENKDEKKSEDKSVSSDVSEATAQSSNEAKPAETPAAPAEEAPAVEETKNEEPGEAAPAEDSTAAPAGASEAMLLAALIQCECNGPYEAQLAVGAVVMNRVKSGYGSITNAIYAPHQFGPASSGKLARTLATGAISATAMQAANDAISGVSNVGNARYFRNVSSGHAGIVIGNHVYW